MGNHPGEEGVSPSLPPTRTATEDTHPAPRALADAVRPLVGGRYALGRHLGNGGHGAVWAAEDRLTGAIVAVKRLRDPGRSAHAARVRREIAALRLLRVPGVVRLLDEGADEQGAFVVMELIEGTAFPGLATPCAWRELADTTRALLETLGRIHAVGVVHRDLKPANVLVDRAGRPVVLDFGVAWAPLEVNAEAVGELVGTPAYLAPEQVAREPIGPGTDLYALGVMLYEALSGRTPFHDDAAMAVLYARVFRDPTPLRQVAPEVPRVVADTVDLMLRRHLEERPRSAADVLRLLRGDGAARVLTGAARIELPRLGGMVVVDALVRAALARRPATLACGSGMGRSRALREAAITLEGHGVRCVRTARGASPFASLDALLGTLDAMQSASLDEVVRTVDSSLAEALDTGAVVVVDDPDELDVWSRAALERVATRGAVLGLSAPDAPGVETIALDVLQPGALEALFAGHERVFHVPSDAARALWARTGGVAARVAAETAAWVRAGVARWDAQRLVIDRRAIDALSLGGVAPRPPSMRTTGASLAPHLAPPPGLPPTLLDLLAWVTLASPAATLSLLARASQMPAWRVEAALDQLVAAGAVRRAPEGRWEPVGATSIDLLWPPERRRHAHASLAAAFEPGSEGRLAHLVAVACLDDAPPSDGPALGDALALEATALACRRAQEGCVGPAVAALSEGMMAARRLGVDAQGDAALRLLTTWTELALAEGTPHALDRVLYELCRVPDRAAPFDHLTALVRAALAARSGGERGLELADDVAPFPSLRMELCRHAVRVQAARRCPLAREEAVVADLTSIFGVSDAPDAALALAEWQGRLRYRQLRFVEAAALFDEGARRAVEVLPRLRMLTGAASAWLEALRPLEALERARELREAAARCRHAYFEAWGEHLTRAAAYRAGAALPVDHELVDIVAALGMKDLEALVCLQEAAVAWRGGDLATSLTLAARTHSLWMASGWGPGAQLARALVLASGAPCSDEELASLSAQVAGGGLARVAHQTLALLARARPDAREVLAARASGLDDALATSTREVRLEVLSLAEVDDALGRR